MLSSIKASCQHHYNFCTFLLGYSLTSSSRSQQRLTAAGFCAAAAAAGTDAKAPFPHKCEGSGSHFEPGWKLLAEPRLLGGR